jgi:shikimate dehydrogenase
MTAAYGLIGFPVAQSFSPAWFAQKFANEGIAATYTAFPLEDIQLLPQLLREHPALRGLNVTIPHKQAVIPLLHEMDEAAARIGAVNCIRIRQGVLKGYNTDIIGFAESLKPLLRPHHTRALVLGTGGASRAVRYVLDDLGIAHQSVSRTPKPGALDYETLDEKTIHNHPLIINTTPLGMYPDVAAAPPIPYEALTSDHLLYDLVYNPEETRFLALGRERGTAVKNGREMLELQAEAAWKIWMEEDHQ